MDPYPGVGPVGDRLSDYRRPSDVEVRFSPGRGFSFRGHASGVQRMEDSDEHQDEEALSPLAHAPLPLEQRDPATELLGGVQRVGAEVRVRDGLDELLWVRAY